MHLRILADLVNYSLEMIMQRAHEKCNMQIDLIRDVRFRKCEVILL